MDVVFGCNRLRQSIGLSSFARDKTFCVEVLFICHLPESGAFPFLIQYGAYFLSGAHKDHAPPWLSLSIPVMVGHLEQSGSPL